MKETVQNKIKELQGFLFQEVPEIVKKDISMADYLTEVRAPLNAAIISIAMGLELLTDKNGKEKFVYAATPKLSDIGDLAMILEEYEEKIERNLYNRLEEEAEDDDSDDDSDDDDMEIVEQSEEVSCLMQQIFTDDTIKNISRKKVLKEYQDRISIGTIKSSHLYQLYEAGIKLRRKRCLITVGIIAGVLAAAGITIAVINAKKNHIDDSGDYINLDDTDTTIDDNSVDIDIPEVDMDIPEVDIPE